MQEGWRRLMRTLAAYGEVSIELSVDVQEEPQLAFHDHWASRFGRAHELWRLLAALALRRLHSVPENNHGRTQSSVEFGTPPRTPRTVNAGRLPHRRITWVVPKGGTWGFIEDTPFVSAKPVSVPNPA